MAVVANAKTGLRAVPRATIVQLRAPGETSQWLEREGGVLVAGSPIPVLISSRCDVALACGAAGVNLPENDIPVAEARRLLGDRLVGRSVHSLESATAAESAGADYLMFGPVWSTTTHPLAAAVGLDALRSVCRVVKVPVIAIGGVTTVRVEDCIAAGAAGYASVSLFL